MLLFQCPPCGSVFLFGVPSHFPSPVQARKMCAPTEVTISSQTFLLPFGVMVPLAAVLFRSFCFSLSFPESIFPPRETSRRDLYGLS